MNFTVPKSSFQNRANFKLDFMLSADIIANFVSIDNNLYSNTCIPPNS
jgi:hypothetical protein